jgi:hypothetical protein
MTELQRTKRGLDLGTAADLADLFHELSHNPKTRKMVAKAVKEIAADSADAKRHSGAFADIDLTDQFERFKAEQEQNELKRAQDAMLAQMNAKRAALLTGGPDGSGRKYSEDDLKKIEEMMQRKGYTDYEDAATLYAATLPPLDPDPAHVPPMGSHGATWEFPEWSKFGADPNKAARDTANTVITEFMRKR